MNMRRMYLLLAVCCSALLLPACSNKSSTDACKHEVTMNLDQGKFDEVIASGCADALQKGAAYFGRAGYDSKVVINNLVKSTSSAGTGTTGSNNKLSGYLTDLITSVTEASLNDLDSSITQYTSIPATAAEHKDALFSVSLVQAIKSLSLLKLIAVDMTGAFNTSCDINANTVKDGPDAAACALIAATNINAGTTTACSSAVYSRSTPTDITFSGKSGTYSGLVITLNGTGTTACPKQYAKLLYKDPLNKYWVVTTSAGQQCTGSDNVSYPCPIEQNGQPLDLVTAVDMSLDSAVDSMSSSIASSGTTTSDVQQSVNDIKTKACPSATGCTSTDIASYLQTVK